MQRVEAIASAEGRGYRQLSPGQPLGAWRSREHACLGFYHH